MTVLSESTQRILTDTGCIFFVFFLVAIVVTIYAFIYGYFKEGFIYLAITIVIFTIMAIVYTKPHRKIKTILSDDYPAVELLDKYTVDGNEGEIWTLTEREPIKEQEEGEE